jgi:hypothetical protein
MVGEAVFLRDLLLIDGKHGFRQLFIGNMIAMRD